MAKRRNDAARALHHNSKNARSQTISPRDQLIITTLQTTGCTTSELAGLKRSNIDAASVRINDRRIPITASLARTLKARTGTYIFSSKQGGRLTTRRIEQIVKKYAKKTPGAIRKESIKAAASEDFSQAKQRAGTKHLSEKKTLTEEEIARVRRSIRDERDRLLFDVLLETGMKTNELTRLQTRDLGAQSITISPRTLPINQTLARQLHAYCAQQTSPYVFSSRQRGMMSEKRIYQIIKGYGKALSIDVDPRTLRNTTIARLLRSGTGETTIERQLGLAKLPFHRYGLLP